MSLFLSNDELNDYIGPGDACIKPLPLPPTATNNAGDAGGSVDIHRTSRTKPAGDTAAPDASTLLEPAKVSLGDCLACSGCITSAESVLVSMQTSDELVQQLRDGQKSVIVSLSPQVRASFAAKYNWTLADTQDRLVAFFKSLGVQHVVDLAAVRQVALRESGRELDAALRARSGADSAPVLPLICSACPGWVCYVEKTQAFLIKHLARAKSPQAVLGTLIKHIVAAELGLTPEGVYHVAIMPCYDKKLEASREEFSTKGVPETDLVLTSIEVESLMRQHGSLNLPSAALPSATLVVSSPTLNLITTPPADPSTGELLSNGGNSSGGHLDHVMQSLAWTRFGIRLSISEIASGGPNIRLYEDPRSQIKTVTLVDSSNVELLRMGYVYGFRNIQNLVRALKSPNATANPRRSVRVGATDGDSSTRPRMANLAQFHYIEVMACPMGCINGGGQLKPETDRGPETLQSSRDWIRHSEATYQRARPASLDESTSAGQLEDALVAALGRESLRATFHHVHGESDAGTPAAVGRVKLAW